MIYAKLYHRKHSEANLLWVSIPYLVDVIANCRILTLSLLLASLAGGNNSYAQQRKPVDQIKQMNLRQRLVGSITRKPEADTVFNFKSEASFLPFQGKIIRTILVERIGFERTVQDTTRSFKTFFAKTGNRLHATSREWLIRDNLFIREGKPLNAYRLADNERYLRDLDFILDSRIFVYPVAPGSDSVDVLVVTRDVFGFGASLDPSGVDKYRFRVQNSNLAGMGQRLQYTGQVETYRTPIYGQELSYQKNNILGSFVDATLGYTQINTGRSLEAENEFAYFFRLNRPLFMPFARWAGGAEISRNMARNVFGRPDSLFAPYTYHLHDHWFGYSFGQHHHQAQTAENRHRLFVSARLIDQLFVERPGSELMQRYPMAFENRWAVLGQVAWFRQDFYKTKFVYGFGRTEDVPYGYAASVTLGWEKQGGLERRPYGGIQLSKTFASQNGSFVTAEARAATYWRNGSASDGLVSAGLSYFSRLYPMGNWGVRHFAETAFTQLNHRTIKNPLDINNGNGIAGLVADSLRGDSRLRARIQVTVFTPLKLAGFRFALAPQLDYALLANNPKDLPSAALFQGYSLGIRTRNENLVFNTVELRGYFYPRATEGMSATLLEVRSNLRIKYPTSLVRPPATVFGD